MRHLMRAALLAGALLPFQGTAASAAGDDPRPAADRDPLSAEELRWLDDVSLLITKEERRTYLSLPRRDQRAAFVEAFWKARDKRPETTINEFRGEYEARLETARKRWRSTKVDQAVIYIVNGEPEEILRADCRGRLKTLEIWYYRRSDVVRGRIQLLFYGGIGSYTQWRETDGFQVLLAEELPGILRKHPEFELFYELLLNGIPPWIPAWCREEAPPIIEAMRRLQHLDDMLAETIQHAPPTDGEWLEAFVAGSTDLAAGGLRDALSPAELRWLEDVESLLTPEERRTFLALPRSYQRAGFVEAFWKARDPYPKTPQNEARAIHEARVETARERWGSLAPDQAKVYVVNSEPAWVVKTDCDWALWDLEIWGYEYSDRTRRPFALLFYAPMGSPPFHLWHADEGYAVLLRETPSWLMGMPEPRPGFGIQGDFYLFYKFVASRCKEAEAIINTMRSLEQNDRTLVEVVQQALPVDPEWMADFRSFSTELPASTPPLNAGLRIDYPSRHQSRTVVRGTLLVPREKGAAEAGRGFTLTGEVLRDGALHESFRYVFQLAAPADSDSYPLVFERFLRPGDYRLVLKLEDTQGGHALRLEREITVPAAPAEGAVESTAESPAAALPGASRFRLLAPATDLTSGAVRVDAEVGDPRVQEVSFSVDGKPVLTRRRPPWTVELQLGDMPRSMRVRAIARDATGLVVAEDELQLNPAPHRFAVRVVEPREGVPRAPLRVRAELQAPPDRVVDHLELFFDDTLVATLYQEPWETVVVTLPDPAPTFLRAVGNLADGATAEDIVLLGGADAQRGELEVDLVEVYAAALDTLGRPVLDLEGEDFEVREDERLQTLQRFQRVTDLPLQVGLLVDTSASMKEMLPEVEQAALRFFREALAPGDRAAVLTFSEEPRLAAPFTGDLERLGTALVGLQAGRGTALWDSLVFALHYFQGTTGRRALLVFSDGADRGSRYTFDQALAYAQHSGVSVYAVSFGGLGTTLFEIGRRRLGQLAEATGGQSFVLGGIEELAPVYEKIEEDLRSQYLLVYQSDGQGEAFRAVDVRIKRSGVSARTMRGYIP